MDFNDEYVKDVEIEFLRIIAKLLENGEMELEDAQNSCKLFLTFLPFHSVEDMRQKLRSMSEQYPSMKELEVYELGKNETAKTDEVLEKMRGLMKNNQIDEALQLVQ